MQNTRTPYHFLLFYYLRISKKANYLSRFKIDIDMNLIKYIK